MNEREHAAVDELSLAATMAIQCSYMDHGRRTVNVHAWNRLIQAVALIVHTPPAAQLVQEPVAWMHSRTKLFYDISVNPDDSGLLDEATDKALFIYTTLPAVQPAQPEQPTQGNGE
jgi:hypothetical protein